MPAQNIRDWITPKSPSPQPGLFGIKRPIEPTMSIPYHVQVLQKRYTDYFTLWRNGDPKAYNYDPHDRRAVLDYMTFPRRGPWRGLRRTTHYMGIKKAPSRMRREHTRLGPRVYQKQAEWAAAALGEKLQAADFRVVKTLGWGGLGIACLVDGGRASGERFRVVCKVDLHHEHAEALRREKENHVAMAGARHIVQRVVLQDPPPVQKRQISRPVPSGRTGWRPWKPTLTSVVEDFEELEIIDMDEVIRDIKKMSREELDAKNDLLFIEFMRRGDLGVYIKKAVKEGVRFPDQVLWHIFDCLFKAVIAMAYPNKFRPPGADAENNNMPLMTEDYRSQGPLAADVPTMVHFDLDPLNILVGDYDESEHNTVPLLKVADLGIAEIVDVEFRNDPWKVWAVRRTGKYHILTPEQFTEEWDFIKRTPISMLGAETGTAGNYHWWTNMYQVAQVMWTLISLCHLECPPEPEPYWETDDDGTFKEFWSYGTYLLEDKFNVFDRELRGLVVACMKHNPTERPSMAEIDAIMERQVRNRPAAAEEDARVKLFCQAMFGDPGPPVPGASEPSTATATASIVASPRRTREPRHLRDVPTSHTHRSVSKGRGISNKGVSGRRMSTTRSSRRSSVASRDGASQLNLAPIRVTMDTRRKPEASTEAEAGEEAEPRQARGWRGPPAMDEARLAEINRIARDPLARSRKVLYSRARDWLGL